MSVPKIGRTVATNKDPLIAASNALGYQARKLREKADEHAANDAVLDRLRAIGESQKIAEERGRQQAADHTQAAFAPLIAAVEKQMETNRAAEREARPLIKALDSLNWSLIFQRFSGGHGVVAGSYESTHTRLALIARLVDEAKDVLRGNDTDLVLAVKRSAGITDLDSHDGKYAMNALTMYLGRNDRAVFLRSRVSAIRRILDDIGEDILSTEPTTIGSHPVPPQPPTVLLNDEQVYEFRSANQQPGVRGMSSYQGGK